MFITLEGLDGSGKTTVANACRLFFDNCVVTSEPSQYQTGTEVRRLLQDEHSSPITDFMAFMADRSNHIDCFIQPNLDDGKLVISDRYADSTRAYQYHALQDYINDPDSYIESVMSHWNLEPDLTIYLDISPETAIERADGDEKYEKLTFLRRVQMRYEEIGERFSHRWIVVDGEQDEDLVVEEVLTKISART